MNLLHRSMASLMAILCAITASADPVTEITCEACRGTEHSQDLGNYALNQTYGPGSTIFEGELVVYNTDGGWVFVDLSFVLQENIISDVGDFIGLDLGIPTGQIQIDTTTDSTETDSYVIDLDMIDTTGPLPVGEDDDSDSSDSDTGTGGGGDSSGGGSTGGGGVGGWWCRVWQFWWRWWPCVHQRWWRRVALRHLLVDYSGLTRRGHCLPTICPYVQRNGMTR